MAADCRLCSPLHGRLSSLHPVQYSYLYRMASRHRRLPWRFEPAVGQSSGTLVIRIVCVAPKRPTNGSEVNDVSSTGYLEPCGVFSTVACPCGYEYCTRVGPALAQYCVVERRPQHRHRLVSRRILRTTDGLADNHGLKNSVRIQYS